MKTRKLLATAVVWMAVIAAGNSALEPAGAAPASCDRGRFVIVVDVGHTPQATGATSARGFPEYGFNLNLARLLTSALVKEGFSNTTLLQTTGVGRAQLFERAARTNQINPDILLSLHHDSVQQKYLSRWTFEGRDRWFSDRFSGYSLFVADNNAYAADSLGFARLLGDHLRSSGLSPSLHHAEGIQGENRQLLDPARGIYQYNELVVLKQTRAPAVLIEAGIIVNRADEILLKKTERQSLIVDAILSAANDYCSSKQSNAAAKTR